MTQRERDLMSLINVGAKVLEYSTDFIAYEVKIFKMTVVEIRYYDYKSGEYVGRQTVTV